ncbi:ceramide synthase 5-like [Polistes fuscatus]|uniref:ceramide synthase 5-like n=1 Tax=Polistes fuscatus TaxID=30207 RepID=UPI001CA99D67|nr:ceramide synthase 5-like [Polistes fuscatus]
MPKVNIFKNYWENKYPNDMDLLYPLLLGIIMLVIRYMFIRFVFEPMGKKYGVQGELHIVQRNEILENAYASGKIDYKTIVKLSKQLHWSKNEVKQWFKLRDSEEELPDLRHFCDNCWRGFYATCTFSCGIFIFWNKPWLWDIKECYYDYPLHEVTNDMWWFYILNMAYYWSRIIIHYFSTYKDNFMEFFFHNMVLLAYLHLAWFVNLIRLGILMILGVVFGDIIIED